MKISLNSLGLLSEVPLYIILILFSGCTFQSSSSPSEIIIPPKLPEEISKVKESNVELNLIKLPLPEEVRNNIPLGRIDPFQEPNNNPDTLSIPLNFSFLGIIQTNQLLSAFIKYGSETGLVSKGYVGSIETKLIPKGWEVDDININSGTLDLKYIDQKITLKLF